MSLKTNTIENIAGTKTIQTDNIADIVADFGNSLSTSGYQKLPNGLIIQWGVSATSNEIVTFPITFPTNCLQAVASATNVGTNGYVNATLVKSFTASQLTAVNIDSTGNTTALYRWVAIGY